MTTNSMAFEAGLRAPVQETPDHDTAALQQLDSAHYLHPFTDHGALSARGARVMVRGEGIYLWDSEGHHIIDGMSGLWCVNVGYGRTSITQAVARQMDVLPFYNSFFNTTNVLIQGNTAQGALDWYSGSFRFEGNCHDVTIRYVGHAEQWDAVSVDGAFASGCTVTYVRAGQNVAVATIGRDKKNLEAEVAMERTHG